MCEKGYIYCIIVDCKIDGYKYYIGQTTQLPERRYNQHISHHKDTDWNKRQIVDCYCSIFNSYFTVIDCCDVFDLNAYEKKYIETFCSIYPMGLNFTTGGSSLYNCENEYTKLKRSIGGIEKWIKYRELMISSINREEVKEKIRRKSIEYWSDPKNRERRRIQSKNIYDSGRGLAGVDRSGENNGFYGKKHSEKTIEKLKNDKRDKMKPVIYLKDGNIFVFESIRSASKITGINRNTIKYRCDNEGDCRYL